MRPFRLFIILAFLTAVGLAEVYLQLIKFQAFHRVHLAHERNVRLYHRVKNQQAQIAELSNPVRIQELVQSDLWPVVSPRLPEGPSIPDHRNWSPPTRPVGARRTEPPDADLGD